MYGYVKPYKPDLKVREWETYHAVYCGLCAELKKRYGFAARFTVNYDFTFLIMLLAKPGEEPVAERLRCPGNLRKRAHCFAGEASSVAADLSLILAYHKLRDSLNDDGFFKKMFVTRPLMLILHGKYQKAARIHSLFSENSQKMLDELSGMEHNREKSADLVADTFARLLSAAGEYAYGDINKRIVRNLLYCVGKVIYILDAYDDLDGDRKHKRYNPLLYGGDIAELQENLTRTVAEAAADFELMEPNAFRSILENIFYLGLHKTIETILK
jgi:hypothetical protein